MLSLLLEVRIQPVSCCDVLSSYSHADINFLALLAESFAVTLCCHLETFLEAVPHRQLLSRARKKAWQPNYRNFVELRFNQANFLSYNLSSTLLSISMFDCCLEQ